MHLVIVGEPARQLVDDTNARERLGKAARSFYKNSPFEAKAAANFFASVYGKVLEERKMLKGMKQ